MAKRTPSVAAFQFMINKYLPKEVVTEDENGPKVPAGVVEAKIGIDTDGVPYVIT